MSGFIRTEGILEVSLRSSCFEGFGTHGGNFYHAAAVGNVWFFQTTKSRARWSSRRTIEIVVVVGTKVTLVRRHATTRLLLFLEAIKKSRTVRFGSIGEPTTTQSHPTHR